MVRISQYSSLQVNSIFLGLNLTFHFLCIILIAATNQQSTNIYTYKRFFPCMMTSNRIDLNLALSSLQFHGTCNN